MSDVGSFHFDVSGRFNVSSGEAAIEVPLSFVGDVQAPDRTHGFISLSVVVFALEMEVVIADSVTYTTNSQSGVWEVLDEGALGIPNPADFLRGGEPPVTNASYLGEEERDGHYVHRLVGTAQLEALGGVENATEATIWIGVDDLLLREISVEAEVSLDALGLPLANAGLAGNSNVDLTIKLSEFGKPVSIEVPTVP